MWEDLYFLSKNGFSIGLGFSYIREHLKNTWFGFDETTRAIHKVRDLIKKACEN
jgi:hypothetical protein